MIDQQAFQILSAVRALESRFGTFKGDVNQRFNGLEQCINNLESAVVHPLQLLASSYLRRLSFFPSPRPLARCL